MGSAEMVTNKDMFVSIIIPAYNEEKAVRKSLQEIIKAMEHSGFPHELIAVDDGSEDGTSEEIEMKGVRTIHHESNKGYGASIKTGVRFAVGDTIVITDADDTYPNERIPDLLRVFRDNKSDMVVGARIGNDVNIQTIRKPAKWIITKLASYLTGVYIPDLNSGLRVMKKEIINKSLKLLPNGFSFTTTITLAMLTDGYIVDFCAIDYKRRQGYSKIRPFYDTLNFLQLILRTVMYFNPLRVFFPLSLCFFATGTAFLIRDLISLNLAQSSVMLIVSGTVILSIGLLGDLINKKF